jgi:hypothetical protein
LEEDVYLYNLAFNQLEMAATQSELNQRVQIALFMLNEPNTFAEPTGRRSDDHALSVLLPLTSTGHAEANFRFAQCSLAAAVRSEMYPESADKQVKAAIAALQLAARQDHARALKLLASMQLTPTDAAPSAPARLKAIRQLPIWD